MSQHDDTVPLRHMLDHAREAEEMSRGCSLEDLHARRQLNLALVRLVEIIGEAANRVSESTQTAHPDIPWRQIIAMRNRVIHGYDSVDLKVLWDVTHFDLPPLIHSLADLIGIQMSSAANAGPKQEVIFDKSKLLEVFDQTIGEKPM